MTRRMAFALAAGVSMLTAGQATAQPARATLDPTGPAQFTTAPDGVRIAYEVRGRGSPAIVFVHGWSCDRSYWAGQLQPFAKDFTVVAVDLGGHGESGVGRTDWTIEAFGADVASVVRHLGLERVVLVGHSMGGDVIAEAARLLPGRVVGLVWADAYRTLGKPRAPGDVDAFVGRLRANFVDSTRAFVRGMFAPTSDPRLVERVAADMSSAPSDVALSAISFARRYGPRMPQSLRELQLPVVAINPGDGSTDVDGMRRHGVNVLTMPGVGHFLHQEDPARFNVLLRQAVARLAK